MNCPFCNASNTELRVLETRHAGEMVRRRRKCSVCEERFSTMEVRTIDGEHVTRKNVLLVPKGTTLAN